ncbi:GHKL domain-containing protein [uncultured Vagococcus sp.]|uniref:sensor histidine kinase n=1 Tax=uncultured Vagococcus sp. TaxID=189676 RepID=UPI0028D504B4|nr:GHKL domain-containing protein [uncultured Vagococcus sp.]
MNNLLNGLILMGCLGLSLYLVVDFSASKGGILASLGFLVLICLVSWFHAYLALVCFLFLLSYLIITKKKSLIYLPLVIALITAILISKTNPIGIPVVILAGSIVTHFFKIVKQTTLYILVLISIFEGLLFVLFASTDNSGLNALILLMLFLLLLIVDLVLRYLFQETTMIFARSLDQIMANYISEVDSLYQNIRGWRHDYHNHLQAIKVYLKDGQFNEIEGYLSQLEDKLIEVDQIVKSGNTMLDAIVNSKLSIASDKNIKTTVKVFVGKQPLINDVDLCVIIGNILDNAIEANEEIDKPEKRMMRVYISILKQQLYISVTNSRPLVQAINASYTSTKSDKRGLGIRRIDQLVSKYDGMINRQFEDEIFVTEVILPLMTISDR